MKKLHRKIFFWAVFLLFAVSTPLVIMHSKGYRFDSQRGIFVYSGAITLKTAPSGVRVFLNDREQPSKSLDIINNSLTLNGLKPGTYRVRAEMDGYQEWEKEVEVHSGLSSEFWNVVLAPDNLQPKRFDSLSGMDRFFPSPSGQNIAAVRKNGDAFELWTIDGQRDKSTLLYSAENMAFPEKSNENIEWGSGEDFVLCPILRGDKKDYLIADAKNDSPALFISDLSGLDNISRARWSPKDKNVVYFLSGRDDRKSSGLYRLDLGTKKTDLILDGIVTYNFSSGDLYFLKDNNVLFVSNLDGQNAVQLVSNPVTEGYVDLESRLIAYDKNRQALITADGALFVHNNGEEDTVKKLSDNVKSVQFSDDGKKMLFWNENEVDVLFLRKWDVQPVRAENEIQQISRFSSPIDNVFWYRDYEHIFFESEGKVKLIELDPRDHRTAMDVYKNSLADFPAAYDLGKGIYYFIGESNFEKKIFYMNLPEKTGILDGFGG